MHKGFSTLTLILAAQSLLILPLSAAPSDDIGTRCSETTNMPPAVCLCIAENAATELTEDQQLLVVALLDGDRTTVTTLQTTMPMTDFMAAGMYMTNAPATCAAATASQ